MLSFNFSHGVIQACTFSSPGDGPLRKDAPTWCRAPFEPEGLLRFIFPLNRYWLIE